MKQEKQEILGRYTSDIILAPWPGRTGAVTSRKADQAGPVDAAAVGCA